MNIKIKSSGVFCLIGDDYDKVYSVLKKQFADTDEQIFTERTPGHEYLQWELPGDGWTSLSAGDPIMSQEVRTELKKRQQSISQRFGSNQAMAQKILSVPGEDYVYYKHDESGRLIIRLTAWGYRYPERIHGGEAAAELPPDMATEHVTITIVNDGKAVPNRALRINGFARSTGETGTLIIGNLPIGYIFNLDADDYHKQVEVKEGNGDIRIDITKFVNVHVLAKRDGAPYSGANVSITYGEHSINVQCDEAGMAVAKLPRADESEQCTVCVDNITQADRILEDEKNFIIEIKSPKVEPAIRNANVEVEVIKDGKPYTDASININYQSESLDYKCDAAGKFSTSLELSEADNTCIVTVEDSKQSRILKEGDDVNNKFLFDLTSSVKAPTEKHTKVQVLAFLDGAPYSGAKFTMKLNGEEKHYCCDSKGVFFITLPYKEGKNECTVTLGDDSQTKNLLEGDNVANKFVFRANSPKTEDEKSEVNLIVTLDGKPYSSAGLVMKYNGVKKGYTCDTEGLFNITLPYIEKNNTCSITIDKNTLKRDLVKGTNVINFDLKSVPYTPWWVYLLEFLFALLLLIMTVATYFFCKGMLFG